MKHAQDTMFWWLMRKKGTNFRKICKKKRRKFFKLKNCVYICSTKENEQQFYFSINNQNYEKKKVF